MYTCNKFELDWGGTYVLGPASSDMLVSKISNIRKRMRRARAGRPEGAERSCRSCLVGPASSDMLVSKIKPCHCNYEYS